MPFLVKGKVIYTGQTLNKEWLSKAIDTLKERSKTLIELAHSLSFYITEGIEFDEKAKKRFLTEKSLPYLIEVKEAFSSLDLFIGPEIEKVFADIVSRYNIKLGNLAQPVRVAVTGKAESPGIFEVLEILGREKTLKRLEKAVGIITSQI